MTASEVWRRAAGLTTPDVQSVIDGMCQPYDAALRVAEFYEAVPSRFHGAPLVGHIAEIIVSGRVLSPRAHILLKADYDRLIRRSKDS